MNAQTHTEPVTTNFTPEEVAARLDRIEYAGRLDRGEGPRVAIIGARACTPYGEHVAGDLAAQFVGRGWCIAATFSFGIDAAALRGGLAASGRVMGVAPQSLNVPYPKSHDRLYAQVQGAGVAASVYPEEPTPSRVRFRMTHTILAHLADAVVVVEAGRHSSTLLTVNEAHRLGKPVYAVPGPITSVTSSGTNQLLRDNRAQVLTCAADADMA